MLTPWDMIVTLVEHGKARSHFMAYKMLVEKGDIKPNIFLLNRSVVQDRKYNLPRKVK